MYYSIYPHINFFEITIQISHYKPYAVFFISLHQLQQWVVKGEFLVIPNKSTRRLRLVVSEDESLLLCPEYRQFVSDQTQTATQLGAGVIHPSCLRHHQDLVRAEPLDRTVTWITFDLERNLDKEIASVVVLQDPVVILILVN